MSLLKAQGAQQKRKQKTWESEGGGWGGSVDKCPLLTWIGSGPQNSQKWWWPKQDLLKLGPTSIPEFHWQIALARENNPSSMPIQETLTKCTGTYMRAYTHIHTRRGICGEKVAFTSSGRGEQEIVGGIWQKWWKNKLKNAWKWVNSRKVGWAAASALKHFK